jgi:hypothetical protein
MASKQEAAFKAKYLEIVKEIWTMKGEDESEDVMGKIEDIKADLALIEDLKT